MQFTNFCNCKKYLQNKVKKFVSKKKKQILNKLNKN